MVLKMIAVVTVLIAASSCTQLIGEYTVLSTKNVSLSDKFIKIGRMTEDNLTWSILFIPFGAPTMEKTVDQILEHNDGDVITNAKIKSYTMVFFLVNRFGLIIEGDVWKRATMGDLRRSENVFELHVLPNGRQELVSIHDSKIRHMVTTNEDLSQQIENMQ